MTPLELIKAGIQQGDWDQVTAGYQQMTGERVASLRETEDHPNHAQTLQQIRALCDAAMAGVADEGVADFDAEVSPGITADLDVEDIPLPARPLKEIRFDPPQPNQRPNGTNLFFDDGSVATEDKEFDRKVLPKGASPRRPPIRLVDIVCSKCGAKQQGNPALLPRALDKEDTAGGYVCDACIGRMRR